ncbi:MAG: hypothetical protein GQ574_24595 [Crocinitomix sp.]|nr:hypothetical protein [Crocinitomix sp.]
MRTTGALSNSFCDNRSPLTKDIGDGGSGFEEDVEFDLAELVVDLERLGELSKEVI